MDRPDNLRRVVRLPLIAVALAVCLTPLRSQSDAVARVVHQEGRVSVLRGPGEVALFLNDSVKPTETIVTGADGYAQFQITDGSTFEVFANSRVVFKKTFNTWDMLDLWIGKVKLMIDHTRGPNPKKVSTPTAVISVRGTVFTVTVEDAEGTTLVSVDEGLVGVKNVRQPGDEVLVHPAEELRVFANQRLGKVPANNPAGDFVKNRVKGAVIDLATNNPGGVHGGSLPGTSGGGTTGNGDNGKKKGTAPGGAPPPAGGK